MEVARIVEFREIVRNREFLNMSKILSIFDGDCQIIAKGFEKTEMFRLKRFFAFVSKKSEKPENRTFRHNRKSDHAFGMWNDEPVHFTIEHGVARWLLAKFS